jgi:hypothetical protein
VSVRTSGLLIRDVLCRANEGHGTCKVVVAKARLWPGGVSNALMPGIRCRQHGWAAMEKTSLSMDVLCASQEDVDPKLALWMCPLLLHVTMDEIGGGTGGTMPGMSIDEGVRGVPLAVPPASAVSDSMKR